MCYNIRRALLLQFVHKRQVHSPRTCSDTSHGRKRRQLEVDY